MISHFINLNPDIVKLTIADFVEAVVMVKVITQETFDEVKTYCH